MSRIFSFKNNVLYLLPSMFLLATIPSAQPHAASITSFFWKNQTYILYAATAAVILLYIYLFFKLQYKPTKLRATSVQKKASKKISK
jgi:hypothetical protein